MDAATALPSLLRVSGLSSNNNERPNTQKPISMKNLSVIAAVFAAGITINAQAQLLTPTAGHSSTQLFQTAAGLTIGGLEADSSGNIYYLTNGFSSSTKLMRRSAGDGYASETLLFDYGSTVFGSFVRLNAGKLYLGENTAGTIRTFDLSNSSVSLLATVGGNYDLDFGGGYGWLSVNPGYATFATQNEVQKLNLTSGVTTTVLTSSDYSGPLALDAAGTLYYGATMYGAGGDIFKYTAAELAAGGLGLDAEHNYIENPGNAYFAYGSDGALYSTDFSSIIRNTLGAVPGSESWATSSQYIGNLAEKAGTVFATVTDYGANRSAVFAVVPEPATSACLLFGAGLLFFRRRR